MCIYFYLMNGYSQLLILYKYVYCRREAYYFIFMAALVIKNNILLILLNNIVIVRALIVTLFKIYNADCSCKCIYVVKRE